MAMDTCRSVQVHLMRDSGLVARWESVTAHAVNDVGHWLVRNSDEDPSESAAFTP
ncbi:hypothetical protein PC119_g16198 [Phytophthora cactorum]|nr:hypothetical protein PC120_g21922 [Phytophthora cactorum]KAG3002829.1 hypothetical protein PC119_g16198 [Phytophthora cactorum]KAG3155618.1 hypothetical protein C6341_g15376 [Phytophthora cactorum]KAG3205157.1 hypothetical protein PC128_g1542 [Phytophthora cactorum]KAG4041035.1 hypothetical protein PC123_g23440 [Phytophthora cactorum]